MTLPTAPIRCPIEGLRNRVASVQVAASETGGGMRFAGVLAVLMLAGCVAFGAKDGAGPSGASAGVAPKPNPIIAGEIATTSLDAPAPGMTTPAPVKADEAKAEPTEEVQAKPVKQAAPVPPPEPKSPEEVKCLKSGDTWASAGKSGARTCVKRTKDAGKACTRQTQCEGYCLARSRTCAPITPMFGCNDILQADGREATLCLD